MEFAATGTDVVTSFVVEVGEGDGWDSHVAGGGRLHGFANDLRGGGNGNEIEFLAEGADEDGLPEALDGLFGLSVVIEPLLKTFASVTLNAEREGNERARDGEFVGGGEKVESEKRWRGVERRGKRRGLHHGDAAAGLDEIHLIEPADLAGDSDAVVELH